MGTLLQKLSQILHLPKLLCHSCKATTPPNITPVKPYDISRYLGTWYEIARFDHSFERNLICVQAQYSPLDDKTIQVTNKGYNPLKKKWSQAIGRAHFTRATDEGSLRVSFFRPFYGGYNIVALDMHNYQWALIQGNSTNYFWILARQRQIPEALKHELINKTKQLGLDANQLIWVDQNCIERP